MLHHRLTEPASNRQGCSRGRFRVIRAQGWKWATEQGQAAALAAKAASRSDNGEKSAREQICIRQGGPGSFLPGGFTCLRTRQTLFRKPKRRLGADPAQDPGWSAEREVLAQDRRGAVVGRSLRRHGRHG